MKKLLFVLLIASCSKQYVPNPTCQRVFYLSDKYALDTSYVRTDTIWPYGRYHNEFCGSDTLQFLNDVDTTFLLMCLDSTYEINRWVIGNKITSPKLYK